MTYLFYLDLCGGSTCGTIPVEAEDLEKAEEIAYEMVGETLYKAFPTLEIDYHLEPAED